MYYCHAAICGVVYFEVDYDTITNHHHTTSVITITKSEAIFSLMYYNINNYLKSFLSLNQPHRMNRIENSYFYM